MICLTPPLSLAGCVPAARSQKAIILGKLNLSSAAVTASPSLETCGAPAGARQQQVNACGLTMPEHWPSRPARYASCTPSIARFGCWLLFLPVRSRSRAALICSNSTSRSLCLSDRFVSNYASGAYNFCGSWKPAQSESETWRFSLEKNRYGYSHAHVAP